MNALLDMLVPAVGVSALSLACLALLPRAPATVRFWIASAGLAAWAVPWPLLKWTLPLPLAADWDALPLVARVDGAVNDLAAAPSAGGVAGAPAVAWLVAAAFAVGAAWLAVDCVRARAVVRAWRARSVGSQALRALLPPHLRATNVAIRTVRDSPYAAASGYWRPTIWIGDDIGDTDTVRVALLHECWHVRRHDPLKVLLLTALRRAYWWNPLVRALSSRASLLLEAECDRRCARDVGKEFYVTALARTMLAASDPPPLPLAAASGTRSTNLLRLDLLNRETFMRTRDHVVLLAFATSVLALAACKTVEPTAPRAASAVHGSNTVEHATAGARIEIHGGLTLDHPSVQFTATDAVFNVDDGSGELSGNVRVKTTAENIIVIKTDRTSAARDSIMLSGNVLIALVDSDLETDELTIRALDGRPLGMQPHGRIDVDGREVELTTARVRVTNAYRETPKGP